MKGDLELLKHQKELFVAQQTPKTQLCVCKTSVTNSFPCRYYTQMLLIHLDMLFLNKFLKIIPVMAHESHNAISFIN